jgi:hypothetical protein
MRALERLRLATASTVYDARLDALEAHLDARDRERGRSNGHEELWPDEDRQGVLQ